MLTQELVKELFDYVDGKLIRIKVSHKNLNMFLGKEAGHVSKFGYRLIKINGKTYRAHRLVFLYHKGYMPEEVDHINGSKSDNRIENLRSANRQENQWNRKTGSNNTSGIKGIAWSTR
ncbi:MAG: hypothetical protein DRQ42_06770, partial [Gammaproteobacteria bacterium]